MGFRTRGPCRIPLCWMKPGPWLELVINPFMLFALLWMSYSLSFGDSDSGHNIWGLVQDPFNWEE